MTSVLEQLPGQDGKEESTSPRPNGMPTRAPAPAGEKLYFALLVLAAGFFLFELAGPLRHGSVYAVDDLVCFHLPLRQFYASCLARGEDFHWNPWLFCGFYVHGEGQVGMDHPLHLTLYGLLPLTWAFNLEFLLNFVFLQGGMYLWLRGWVGRRDAALLGALLFSSCGFCLGHGVHLNALAIVAHLPWLLLAVDRLIDGRRPRSRAGAGLALGLLTASELLLGYPQYVLFTALAQGIYVLVRWPGWRCLVTIGTVTGLGILAGCVQLLPTAESLSLSQRSQTTLDFRGAFSLHPLHLGQLLFPHALAVDNLVELSLRNALFVSAAAAYLLALLRAAGVRRLAWFAVALLAIGLFAALGRYNPWFAVYSRLPGMSCFRCPGRFLVLVEFAAAVGAALLWRHLSQRRPDGRLSAKHLGLCLLPLTVLALAGLAPILGSVRRGTSWPEGRPQLCLVEPTQIVEGLLWTAGFTGLLGLCLWKGGRFALSGLLVFTLAEQYRLAEYWWTETSQQSLAEIYASVPPPPDDCHGGRCQGPPVGFTSNLFNLIGIYEIGRPDGYVGLPPRQWLDYRDPLAARVAGVVWKYERDQWRPAQGLPRVRLVSRTRCSEVPGKDLSAIDVATTALVSRPVAVSGGTPGTARMLSDRPGAVTVEVEAPTRQLLVLAESFHPGWQVWIDGRRGACVSAYGDFLGCAVEAGRHRVEYRFRPASLRRGARLSALGLGLLFGWFVWAGWWPAGRWSWMPGISKS